ncbi:MAG: hypothetical protein JWO54_894 [Candidatus Saccharibacteria bacterium]|nr:hypothetical protein [Candidatus Saccharibacteria bacterium]MDB5181131.1 hypothetical protein [Candidatus Saccharibacteria bacterium]
MKSEQNFFVYRPLQRNSSAVIKSLQKEYSSIKTFVPVRDPHLTILSSFTDRIIPISRFQNIMEDAPETAETTFDTEIVKATLGHRARDLTRYAVRLVLDDQNNAPYLEEHEQFKKEVIKTSKNLHVRHFMSPHVTVGYLDSGHALGSVMESANELVGSSLSFGPIESSAGKAIARRIINTPPSRPTSEVIKEPIRTLQQGVIPAAFLSTIRPRDLEV